MAEDVGSSSEGYRTEERAIAAGLYESGYESLLALARNRRRRAGFRDTMMTEDILHECFLKLSGQTVWQSPEQFMRTAALAIRQVVVDHARRKLTHKRGNAENNLTYDDETSLLPEFNETPEQIVVLNDLLEQFEQQQPRLAQVFDARYFAGMTEVETASILGMSERTVRRNWQAARAWLADRLRQEE